LIKALWTLYQEAAKGSDLLELLIQVGEAEEGEVYNASGTGSGSKEKSSSSFTSEIEAPVQKF
jgi:hypothetical protein